MKWTALIAIPLFVSGCAWLEPEVIHPRDVIVTKPPNSFLEPFTCGARSVNVTTTTRVCQKGCEAVAKTK